MIFFCDNNISTNLTKACGILAGPYDSFVHLTDEFPTNTIDEIWMNGIKNKGYIVICGDPKIASNPHEKQILIESGLTVFFWGKGWMNMRVWDQDSLFFKVIPDIKIEVNKLENNGLFSIDRSGKITQKYIQ